MYPPPGMLGPRAIAEFGMRTGVARWDVYGREHIPRDGPVLIVARHYHHLIDGAMLITNVTRPLHLVVAVDWARTNAMRLSMETLCRLAHYPVVVRSETVAATGVMTKSDVLRYTRRALRETTALLRDGRAVVVFPEAYPNVDPAGSRKPANGWLPFQPGFVRMVRHAEREGARVTVVPAGFRYVRVRHKWDVILRFGAPLPTSVADAELIANAEAAVLDLSRV